MNRKIIALFIMAALLLTGCAPSSGEHVVQIDGVELRVNAELGRVTDGKHAYRYTQSEGEITVVYPNGVTYTQVSHDHGVADNIHGDGDVSGYLEPGVVFAAIERRSGGIELDGGSVLTILLGIVVFGLGLWSVTSPESVWMLENGWRFENAEPSDLALALNKVGGVVAMIGGTIMVIAGIFGGSI